MATLAESLLQQINAAQASSGGSAVNGDSATIQSGLAAAIPALITALGRNAQSKDGAAALHDAIAKDHDGSVIDNLGSYLQNPDLDDGDGILEHALGNQREPVAAGISQQTGLDMNTIAKLLQMAAPLVLGMLAKQQQQKNLSANDLAGLLDEERQQEAQANPDLMQMVSGLLDQNDDGSVMDEVQSLAGKLFGRKRD
ncbi:MAG TPA: DUF937 domain-containing protein [Thermomicrobiales bacterium]|nr:DUF937 domain-containing protein [Thermomicrobiales bacterium]